MWDVRTRGVGNAPSRRGRVRLLGVSAAPPEEAYRVTRSGATEVRGGSEASHQEMQAHAEGILRFLEENGFVLERMTKADFEAASRLLGSYPGAVSPENGG